MSYCKNCAIEKPRKIINLNLTTENIFDDKKVEFAAQKKKLNTFKPSFRKNRKNLYYFIF